MAKAYPINPNYGLILTDDGKVLPMTNSGLIDLSDTEAILQLALAAAVEIKYLEGELHRVAGSIDEALNEFNRAVPPLE